MEQSVTVRVGAECTITYLFIQLEISRSSDHNDNRIYNNIEEIESSVKISSSSYFKSCLVDAET